MGFQIERTGFIGVEDLATSIIQDLIAHGFTVPGAVQGVPGTFTAGSDKDCVLDATVAVDPLAATQPWRMFIKFTDTNMDVFAATPNQISAEGTVSSFGTNDLAGSMNGTPNTQHFYSLPTTITTAMLGSYPISYQLSITDHGVALFIWNPATDSESSNFFSWFVIQRPVDHLDGTTYVSGKAPLFAVFYKAHDSATSIYRYTVRETDIARPTLPVLATQDSQDVNSIINASVQVAINEDNKYVVTFPNGLNTQRHAYTQELDMIGYTSADVISQWSEVPLTVYGEATPRIYKAMRSNSPFNTGMRIMMVKQCPSIPAATGA